MIYEGKISEVLEDQAEYYVKYRGDGGGEHFVTIKKELLDKDLYLLHQSVGQSMTAILDDYNQCKLLVVNGYPLKKDK